MRNLVIAVALAASAAFPQLSWADGATPPQSRELTTDASESGVPALLHKLGVNLIAKAQAAECTAEGETCTSNQQCCPGLECTGSPPATCTTED